MIVAVNNLLPFIFRQILLKLQFIFNILTVIFKIFSSLIDPLEEIHHISQADIDLHLIHILEDLSGFDFALDLQGNFRTVHPQFLFVKVHPFPAVVSVLCTLVVFLEEDISLDFGYVFDEERDDLPKFVYALPETQDDGLLEEVEDGVEDLEVVDQVARIFVVGLQEVFDVDEQVFKVGLLLFLLLTLVDTLCFSDVLYLSGLLLLIEAIPFDNLPNSADRREIEVVDICMMRNPNKRLMDISIGEAFHLLLRIIGQFQFLIENFDLIVKQNGRNHSQRNIGLDIFIGLVIAIHADIGQEVDVTQQIVEFVGEPLEEFRQSAGIVPSEDHLHHFVSLLIAEIIGIVLRLRDAVLNLEFEVV